MAAKMCADWQKQQEKIKSKPPSSSTSYLAWQCGRQSFNIYCSLWKTVMKVVRGITRGSCGGDTLNPHKMNTGFHMVTFHISIWQPRWELSEFLSSILGKALEVYQKQRQPGPGSSWMLIWHDCIPDNAKKGSFSSVFVCVVFFSARERMSR